jgi:tRNA pseudouridine38-40 synthase
MNEVAARLIGRQDFATFGQPPQGESTIRTVMRARWQRLDLMVSALPGDVNGTLVFTITADAFLKHMVRRLVGCLLEVGRGRWSVAEFIEALDAQDPARSAPPAAPSGLVFEWVDYGPEWALDFLNENHG